MTPPGPERRYVYKGPVVDGERWAHFVPRPDDIFICTPPKSGTTWTQAICALLIFGRADLAVKPAHISPWIDANFIPLEEVVAMLEAQSHRRFIKTHAPLDGIPFMPGHVHLTVYRDPRDVFLSWRRHAGNMKMRAPDPRLAMDVNEAFQDWCLEPLAPGVAGGVTLESVIHHYRTFKAFGHLEDIHFLHYADMKRDLIRAMDRIAGILGIEAPPPLIEAMAATASFDNMKRKADQFAPNAGRLEWRSAEGFFANGANAQWRDALTPESLAIYDSRMRALLPGADIAWLEQGEDG